MRKLRIQMHSGRKFEGQKSPFFGINLMEFLHWIHLIWGIAVALVAIGLITRQVHGYTPSQDFGDYVFRPEMEFDLNLFPSLVLDNDVDSLKILQLADPQLKLGYMPHRDRKTLKLIRRAIQTERPDLCVVTGDLVYSVFTYDAIRHFAKFMQKLGVKWAYVFGNHDARSGCSKYTIAELLKKYDNCLFAVGPSNIDGKGNYLLNVYKGEKAQENLVYSLVLMDSGAYATRDGKRNKNQYDCIRQSQIEWYNWAVSGLRKVNPHVQSSMFFHIPTKEFANLYYLRELELGHQVAEEVQQQLPRVKIENVTGTVCENVKNKRTLVEGDDGYTVGVYYQGREESNADGIFARVKNLECTKAIFCAHDHANTLKGYYDGVYLGYGLCCGYHTYPYFNKFPQSNVVLNGALWVDERGCRMSKGVTVIKISLEDNYGALEVVDVQASEINENVKRSKRTT